MVYFLLGDFGMYTTFRFVEAFVVLCLLQNNCSVFAVEPGEVKAWVADNLPGVMEDYVYLHQHPEVSFQEEQTAKYIGNKWREAGFQVTQNVGGHGVVALLKNGNGPTVMLRTDLDALPVTEATGLPFASKETVTTASGSTSGVMHACGHDIHMSNLIGVARFMASHQDHWSGTLMLIGQPAEERGAGARAMLGDGLFERFPRPNYAMALHCEYATATGTVAVSPGYSMANVDSVDITVKGKGGHGSAPETAIDPIVQAAELVMAMQTIVSREVKPSEAAVVTVGAINGGTKHNIIGDTCHLQITVRSYTQEVRTLVLAAIKRKALAIADGYAAPKPDIKLSEGTPALRNDDSLTAAAQESFRKAIGSQNVKPMAPVMGGEDFSRYGLAGVPIVMYRLGVVSRQRLDRYKENGQSPPSLHSAYFYPDAAEALPVGMQTMITATLDLMPPK
ncbi:MAG: amidohydrolase [Aureliella sp.]